MSGHGKVRAPSTLRVSEERAENLSPHVRPFILWLGYTSPHYTLYVSSDVFQAVRFKAIVDDDTIILMPREMRAVIDKAHPL